MAPTFRREIGVGASLVLALLAALCGSLENAAEDLPISLVPDPTNEGASRLLKEDVVLSALLIVDIAVPRDVDSAVAELDGVTLLDLDDLRDWAAKGIEKRSVEAASVRVIVGEEVERFTIDVTARQAAPLVAQLHEHAETIRLAELDRFSSRLAGLEPAQRAAVEAVTKGIIAKLLHSPSVRLKEDVGTPSGERNAAAVHDLFDLS